MRYLSLTASWCECGITAVNIRDQHIIEKVETERRRRKWALQLLDRTTIKKIIIEAVKHPQERPGWNQMSVPQRSQRSGSWESKQWHVFSAEMGKIMMHREKKCAAIPCTSTPTDALSWHIITGSKHNNIDTRTHKHISPDHRPHFPPHFASHHF